MIFFPKMYFLLSLIHEAHVYHLHYPNLTESLNASDLNFRHIKIMSDIYPVIKKEL